MNVFQLTGVSVYSELTITVLKSDPLTCNIAYIYLFFIAPNALESLFKVVYLISLGLIENPKD